MSSLFALGDPEDFFRAVVVPFFYIVAFCGVLTVIVWFLCRVLGASGDKADRKDAGDSQSN